MLSFIARNEARLAADAWEVHNQRGRGMLNIVASVLEEFAARAGDVTWDWKPTYSTEDSMEDAELVENKLRFLDAYDPKTEMVIRYILPDGHRCIFVIRTEPTPPAAHHFRNRIN